MGWLLTGRNAPSYYAWSLNITVQRETESSSPKGSREERVPNAGMAMRKGGNCTFDYFSWATWLHRRTGVLVVLFAAARGDSKGPQTECSGTMSRQRTFWMRMSAL